MLLGNATTMKYVTTFLLFVGLISATYKDEIPKECYGKYGGEMPSYSVELDGVMVDIDKHDIYITIDEQQVIYVGGNLKMTGNYSVFRQNREEFLFKTKLTNGKSLSYDFDFILNKKEHRVYITPKFGQTEAVLEFIGN